MDDDLIRRAVTQALRAPSLHNIQPWLWRMGDGVVELYLDTSRRLPATDPLDRELVISCGAALHHVQVALAGLGSGARVRRLPDPDDPGHLATVTTVPGVVDEDRALAPYLSHRRTDRRRYSGWPVPAETLGELAEVADLRGLVLTVAADPEQRWTVYRAAARAAAAAGADPARVAEMAAWSGRPAGAADGVPAAAAPDAARIPGQVPMRPFARPTLAQPPTVGEPEAAALLVLSTPGDTRLQWLRAGEALSALLLTATRAGLATCTLTELLESDEARALLAEALLGSGQLRPQVMIRAGWPLVGAAELPATPRRPPDAVIVALP
ncbi:Acg family FMN-binding oxidoreductase [Pseudonocardia sp.]|uniref:Acg family FMN-binding oxidoreductase n=1 Tax=Pseudonocardia sp. TaxID=60912 RepID=UPI003D0CE18C